MIINIKRNEYAPVFFPEIYAATVNEHEQIPYNLTRVKAMDSDLPVSTYDMFWEIQWLNVS